VPEVTWLPEVPRSTNAGWRVRGRESASYIGGVTWWRDSRIYPFRGTGDNGHGRHAASQGDTRPPRHSAWLSEFRRGEEYWHLRGRTIGRRRGVGQLGLAFFFFLS
jgi:hypothetical protein